MSGLGTPRRPHEILSRKKIFPLQYREGGEGSYIHSPLNNLSRRYTPRRAKFPPRSSPPAKPCKFLLCHRFPSLSTFLRPPSPPLQCACPALITDKWARFTRFLPHNRSPSLSLCPRSIVWRVAALLSSFYLVRGGEIIVCLQLPGSCQGVRRGTREGERGRRPRRRKKRWPTAGLRSLQVRSERLSSHMDRKINRN